MLPRNTVDDASPTPGAGAEPAAYIAVPRRCATPRRRVAAAPAHEWRRAPSVRCQQNVTARPPRRERESVAPPGDAHHVCAADAASAARLGHAVVRCAREGATVWLTPAGTPRLGARSTSSRPRVGRAGIHPCPPRRAPRRSGSRTSTPRRTCPCLQMRCRGSCARPACARCRPVRCARRPAPFPQRRPRPRRESRRRQACARWPRGRCRGRRRAQGTRRGRACRSAAPRAPRRAAARIPRRTWRPTA